MTIIGIDPGKSGAMAIIYEDNGMDVVPFSEDDFIEAMDGLLFGRQGNEIICYLEEVHAMPGGGIRKPSYKSQFTFGGNFGFIRGALRAYKVPTELVRPQVWQKGLSGLQGLKGADRKRKLKEHASRLFQAQKPTLKTADALLIARYGKQQER